jgi:molybdopterin synthase sulfur carrier subunit
VNTVEVRYFAVLRDRRGLARESISTTAENLTALYAELSDRHQLGLGPELVRFAINGEFVSGDTPLYQGLQIALIPPVAGG